MLEYLYTKDLNVVRPTMPIDLMIDTFVLSNQYSLEPLKCKLEVIISLSITDENVCSLMLFADAHQAVKVRNNFIYYYA